MEVTAEGGVPCEVAWRARFQQFVDTAIDAVVEMDQAGRICNWNPRAEAIFGWSRAEVSGRTVAEVIVPPSYRRAHTEGLQAYLQAGTAVLLGRRIELEGLHKNGNLFPIGLTVSASHIDGHVRFSAFIRDITERRRMEAALREELRISQAIATVSSQLRVTAGTDDLLGKLCEVTTQALACEFSYTVLLGDDGQWVPARGVDGSNGEWESIRMLKFPAEPLIATLQRDPVICLTAAMTDLPFAWLLERYGISAILVIGLRRGENIIGFQTAGHRRVGASFTAHQMRAAGELAKVASIAIENARLVQELRRADQLKSEFVATRSHELRTPLHVILGYHEMLIDGAFDPLTPDQYEVVERMGRSASELNELITATLDLSRLEAGRLELNLEEVDLESLGREIELEMRPLQIAKPSVRLRWRIAPETSGLWTDRAKLKVVIKNIVTNGLKFTDSGSVTVDAQETREGIQITVSDTGAGIPARALELIFEPFLQLDPSPTRRHGGVGLGLHIVRRLTDILAGTIRAESMVGDGSRFTVEIPLTHPSFASDPEWISSDGTSGSSRLA